MHRMHHQRLVQEKNRLMKDIKRLRKDIDTFEPAMNEVSLWLLILWFRFIVLFVSFLELFLLPFFSRMLSLIL